MPPAPAPALVSMVTSQGQQRQPRSLETKGVPRPAGPGARAAPDPQGGSSSPGALSLANLQQAWPGGTWPLPQRPGTTPQESRSALCPLHGAPGPARQALPTPRQEAQPSAWYPPGAVGQHGAHRPSAPAAPWPPASPPTRPLPTAPGCADKTQAPATRMSLSRPQGLTGQ